MPVLFFIFGVVVLAAFAFYLHYRFTEYDDKREVFDDTPEGRQVTKLFVRDYIIFLVDGLINLGAFLYSLYIVSDLYGFNVLDRILEVYGISTFDDGWFLIALVLWVLTLCLFMVFVHFFSMDSYPKKKEEFGKELLNSRGRNGNAKI